MISSVTLSVVVKVTLELVVVASVEIGVVVTSNTVESVSVGGVLQKTCSCKLKVIK